MTSRRAFLAGLTSATLTPSLGWSAVGSPVALSAAMAPDGSYLLVGLTAAGDIAFRAPLPARGHAAAAHPEFAEAVAIARRPGAFAKVIDCAAGVVRQTLSAPHGRHFYGHGAFSADGALLFTTENDIATGNGRIGVWDRGLGYERIDEFPSAGIGPHEILRLPSGTLAVANGGIRTHPDRGREKLNLETMEPNLSLFSVEGRLLDQATVPREAHQNSLRHIAAAPDNTVICGFQWQGDPFDTPPLVALYRGDGTLLPGQFDESTLRGLDGYIGSVSAFGSTEFAASSPRGGRLMSFDADATQTNSHRATDVCGVSTLGPKSCLVTDGTGRVYALGPEGFTMLQRHTLAFDNHLVALG